MSASGRVLAGLSLLCVVAAAARTTPALATESAAGPKDPARAITSQLICPCSCGEILSGCTCETGKTMQGYVSDALRDGKGKDEIVASLVSQYGEVIRGAPKPEGFNLIVWVAPFLATAFGLVIVTLLLRQWVARRAEASAAGAGHAPLTTAEQDLSALRARVEAEVRRLRE